MSPAAPATAPTQLKRALVTGGSGALGSAIALRLAASGNNLHVIVHANQRLDAAQAVVEQIRAAGGSAQACRFDLTSREATLAACEQLLQDGPIQILVNNAGTHDDAAFPALRAEQWRQVIDVSLNGFFHVTQPLMLPMIRTRWGRVINISSVSAITGNRGQVNYAAAKGALNSATKALALEVASRGITVNAVAPGIIDAGMAAAQGGIDMAATVERIVPMKRAGTPGEVAALVAFLASNDAAYISGQVISINGAMA